MNKKENIKEDAAITTTDNAGMPLVQPQLPIKPNNILTRYRALKKSKSIDIK